MNIAIVDRLEREIDAYYENELVRELEHYSLFEHINMEKMTPHFLKLAKCTKADNKLCDIRYDNGNNFQDEEVLKEFVVSYYENLYKLPDDQKNNINGCIEDFLGAELLKSDLVKKMKINRQTINLLERDISIEELDAAAAECKTKSAGGPDGISNGFIKKFWTFLRIPLRNYITFCNKRGQLSPSFLTATIKLIPKKGDSGDQYRF